MTPGTDDLRAAGEPVSRDSGSTVPSPETVTVVLSGERARLTRVTVPTQRVRLRKVIVTHEETITVTVRREELHIDHEDLAPADTVSSTTTPVPESEPGAFEIVLHEERLIVERVVVPVERVQVAVDRIVEDVDIRTTLRHERLDVTRTGNTL